jgi:methyl-accepting chemotaxis protein
MKIHTKLALTFSAVLALLLMICVTMQIQMARANAVTHGIVNGAMQKKQLLSQISNGTNRIALLAYHALEVPTPEGQAAVVGQIKDQAQQDTDWYAQLKSLLVTDGEKAELDQLIKIRTPYANSLKPAYAQVAAHDMSGAAKSLQDSGPFRDATLQALSDFSASQQRLMLEEIRQSQASYETARVILWGLAALSIVVAAVLCVIVTRSIIGPLGGEPHEAVTLASAVAGGNLRVAVRVHPGDQSSLMYALKTMRDQLATMVHEIKTSSEAIAVAAGEIAQGNTDLSRRTEEQAASLEETASSMEELTATVRHNADNAKQAASLANTASTTAQRGGDVIGRVVETMSGISGSSTKMSEIISVIEGIAFQTNILALNAAVEAARAGEQGRGFAVVAGEVRTLAQRSATAAKEIKDLISESVDRVDAGTRLVEEASGTIGEIVESVKRVTDIVGEISSASKEQSTGIEQVNTAVSQMDKVTQQNAALVEEASAAAQSMAQQAQGLRATVGVFKVDDAGTEGVRRDAALSRAKSGMTKPAQLRSADRVQRAERAALPSASSDESEPSWQTF